jgi:hypothetical protein
MTPFIRVLPECRTGVRESIHSAPRGGRAGPGEHAPPRASSTQRKVHFIREGLALISALFRIERIIAETPRKKREVVRLAKSRPIVDRFFSWCDALVDRVIDDTPIAQALRYGRHQRDALCRFLDDGRLPLHNNISEGQLRREVLGRRNWLFIGTDDAAQVMPPSCPCSPSCALHALEPSAYRAICFPGWPKSRVLELAPAYWQKTRGQADTQQRLAANAFRAALLNLDHPAPS